MQENLGLIKYESLLNMNYNHSHLIERYRKIFLINLTNNLNINSVSVIYIDLRYKIYAISQTFACYLYI